MKSVIALSLAALAVADTQSYWGDAPVDPVTTTTTQWEDDPSKYSTTTTKPVVKTTTTASTVWSDYDPKKTTTTTVPSKETTTWDDVEIVTKTVTYTKKGGHVVTVTITKPADSVATTWVDAETIVDPEWQNVVSTTTKPVSPASTWADAQVCKVVTKTITASSYIWVPSGGDADPTWSDVPVKPTTTKAADPTWSDYTKSVKPTSTAVDPTWSDYTPAPTTTVKPTTTKGWTTSTTAAPKPTGAVCPNDGGKTLASEGSCGSSFSINCGVKASPGKDSKFWQKNAGEKVSTLAACLAICNENALCESVLYVQSAGSADDQLCWQTSGLGPVTGTGYAQIAYKTGNKGKCSASYTA